MSTQVIHDKVSELKKSIRAYVNDGHDIRLLDPTIKKVAEKAEIIEPEKKSSRKTSRKATSKSTTDQKEVRKQHPKAYTKWTAEDETILKDEGPTISLNDLVAKLQRPFGSIQTRAKELGVKLLDTTSK